MRSVTFTGHRPEKMPFGDSMDEGRSDELKAMLLKEIQGCIEQGYDTFYCGCARGIDILCGEIVLSEKRKRQGRVILNCIIPFEGQERRWSEFWKKRYRRLLSDADYVVKICSQYQKDCYYKRNRYMVEQCDLVMAVYRRVIGGGTGYTVNYAMTMGKRIILIDPVSLERMIL